MTPKQPATLDNPRPRSASGHASNGPQWRKRPRSTSRVVSLVNGTRHPTQQIRAPATLEYSIPSMEFTYNGLHSQSPEIQRVQQHLGDCKPLHKDGQLHPLKTQLPIQDLTRTYLQKIWCLHGLREEIISEKDCWFKWRFWDLQMKLLNGDVPCQRNNNSSRTGKQKGSTRPSNNS